MKLHFQGHFHRGEYTQNYRRKYCSCGVCEHCVEAELKEEEHFARLTDPEYYTRSPEYRRGSWPFEETEQQIVGTKFRSVSRNLKRGGEN